MPEYFGDDLVLLERIASGGMAEVYRAKQLGYAGFEKTVAVKRILPNFAENEEFKAMFRQEANLSAQLQHSHIAHVFGNGQFEDYLYLVMEFVDGKNIRQILARADKRKVKIPIEVSLHVMMQVAQGLHYAHEYSDERTGQHLEIVHRDMSPQNVMISYDGAVKVVDFGIAKAAARSGSTRAGVLKGKFGYMSPEQAQGIEIDRRTDVFAMGIILFELITQRRLFTSDDDLKTLQLVKEARVPRPSKYNPGCPSALDAIVLKALSKERGDRYATAEEFYADIARFALDQFPKFLPSEISRFLKDLFKEDMIEERRKRDELNAKMPVRQNRDKRGERESASGGVHEDPTTPSGVDAQDRATEPHASQDAPTHIDAKPEPQSEASTDPGGQERLPSDRQPIFGETPLHLRGTGSGIQVGPDGVPMIKGEFGRSSPGAASRPIRMKPKERKPLPTSVRRVMIAAGFALLGYAAWQEGLIQPAAEWARLNINSLYQSPSVVSSVESSQQTQTETQTQTQTPQTRSQDLIERTADRMPASGPTERESDRRTASARYGYITIRATPEARLILVSGQPLEDANGKPLQTPLERHRIEVGSHTVTLENSFFGVTYTQQIEVKEDIVTTIEAKWQEGAFR